MGLFATYLRTNVRTPENWAQGRAKPNAQAALLINLSSLDYATSGFNYDMQNLETSIIPACRAVAFHNIQPTVSCAQQIIPLITLKGEPLIFLACFATNYRFGIDLPRG